MAGWVGRVIRSECFQKVRCEQLWMRDPRSHDGQRPHGLPWQEPGIRETSHSPMQQSVPLIVDESKVQERIPLCFSRSHNLSEQTFWYAFSPLLDRDKVERMSVPVVIIKVVEKCCRAVVLVILRRAELEGSKKIMGVQNRQTNALNMREK